MVPNVLNVHERLVTLTGMERFERLTGDHRRAARRLRWFLAALAALIAALAVASLLT